jgi:hypothetical protein
MRAEHLLPALALAMAATAAVAGDKGDKGETIATTVPAYRACVLAQARVYEPSREPAQDIATAALAGCFNERAAVLRVANRQAGTPEGAERAVADTDQILRQMAVALVVQIRLERNTAASK